MLDSCEFYSVQSNEWISLAPLPISVHGSGAALPNQVLCLTGGRSDQGIEKRAWVTEYISLILSKKLAIKINHLSEVIRGAFQHVG